MLFNGNLRRENLRLTNPLRAIDEDKGQAFQSHIVAMQDATVTTPFILPLSALFRKEVEQRTPRKIAGVFLISWEKI